MLHIIHSNRAERLLTILLDSSSSRPPTGLEPELVLVPGVGMSRWLTYEIARRRGIACNIRFGYLAGYVWELFSSLVPDIPAESPFDIEVMAWRLFGLFRDLPAGPSYSSLRAYLEKGDPRSHMALARKIAGVFSQYLVYRPDWLETWRGGTTHRLEPAEVERWQARLWREVLAPVAHHEAAHPQETALSELRRRVGRGERVESLPIVLRVFSIPLMAPAYVRVLAQLAEIIDVELYVLNPCREYWADIVSEKELARQRLQSDSVADHREVGHALLASWGKQARDNLSLLVALTGEQNVEDEEHFEDPESNSVLHRLQRSILGLMELEVPDGPELQNDRSLQIHACHSLTRQLEVLHDQLLAIFEGKPGLLPSDVAVMVPDLETAAPLIEAVFDTVPRDRRIPFAIRGRADSDATPLLRAFSLILALPRSRLEAASVTEVLQVPALARRFGLDEEDLELIDSWLRETGVRWGLDGAHREQLGLPAEQHHTWAEGLSRLLLGYALPGQSRGTMQDVLPYDEIEGSSALTAGKLARAVAEIAKAATELRAERTVQDWCTLLNQLLVRMFEAEDEEEVELQRVRDAITALGASAARGEVTSIVPFDVIAQCLSEEIAARAPGAVPTGSVTFCGIGTLRGIPYRVVCLLGMDDGAFPRNPSPVEFDLMATHPRLGDRARRVDDRGSFLDALLAARDTLYLSYTGNNVRDNATTPPSILVSELLEYLCRGSPDRREVLLNHFVTRHRLQPFSHRYFDGGRLFSYAREYINAAANEAAGGKSPAISRGILDAHLPPPGEEWRRVDVEALAQFFTNPAKYVLQKRLRVEIKEAQEELPDEEPFELDRPAEWRLAERLLQALLAGRSTAEAEQIGLAGPELPHGPAGTVLVRRELEKAQAFVENLRQLAPTDAFPPQSFELPIGEFVLSGAFSWLSNAGLFGWRYARGSYWAKVSAWIHHLAMCAISPAGVEHRTRWLCQDGILTFSPVENAAEHLATLLHIYWEGLVAPPRFMPKTASALLEENPSFAAKKWRDDYNGRGDCLDPWYQLGFGESDEGKIPDQLSELAPIIVGPMLEALRPATTPVDAEPPAPPAPAKRMKK